jgi:hypothetical protein
VKKGSLIQSETATRRDNKRPILRPLISCLCHFALENAEFLKSAYCVVAGNGRSGESGGAMSPYEHQGTGHEMQGL